MEFSLICPNDGAVDVGLEDISSVVFNGFETVDVVFVCPMCGAEIRISAKMPNLLITMLDLSDALEHSIETAEITAVDFFADAPGLSEADTARIERYCEYFKRQLAGVDTVEAFLAEVDAR